MKILAVSDEESPILWESFDRGLFCGMDAIISCGDLKRDYLDYLVTMTNLPFFYVRGNHDTEDPGIGQSLEGHIRTIEGFRFAGLGGSLRYKPGGYMFSEAEMRRRYHKLRLPLLLKDGMDIFVTHVPPRGYGDLKDLPHQGYQVFNRILEVYKPKLMLHGHTHMRYGRITREQIHPSGTRIINVCGYQVIEL